LPYVWVLLQSSSIKLELIRFEPCQLTQRYSPPPCRPEFRSSASGTRFVGSTWVFCFLVIQSVIISVQSTWIMLNNLNICCRNSKRATNIKTQASYRCSNLIGANYGCNRVGLGEARGRRINFLSRMGWNKEMLYRHCFSILH
jgi:hypothetical protein